MSDLQFKHSGSNSRSKLITVWIIHDVFPSQQRRRNSLKGVKCFIWIVGKLLFLITSAFSLSSPSHQRNGPDRHALPHGVAALRLHGLRHQQHRTHPAAAHHPRLRLRDLLHTVRYRGHVHHEQTAKKKTRVHLHPPARRVVLINFFSVLRNKSKTHRTQITLLWNKSCLQAFSCHGLFPYFPITPPRVVVAAKQPGRQNLSCGENLWNEKSVENKHVFQEDKTASRSEFYAKKVQLMGQVLLPASSTFSPSLSEVYEPVIKSGLSSAALRSLVLPRFKLKALQFGTVTMRDSKLVLLRQIKKKRNLKNSAAAEI